MQHLHQTLFLADPFWVQTMLTSIGTMAWRSLSGVANNGGQLFSNAVL